MVEVDLGLALDLLAGAEADGHDGRDDIVDDVGGGDVDTVCRVGAAADHVVDLGFRGDGAGPFDVQDGFFVVTDDDAGICVGENEGGIVERQREDSAEGFDVGEADVRTADDGDGDAGAVGSGGDKRLGVVDTGEVAGGEETSLRGLPER